MRVAALYDIHGNLPALEAVLADARRAGADAIVGGGDVVPGPMPVDTLDALLDLERPAHFLRGNGDREVLARLGGTETDTIPTAVREIMWGTARQLRPEHEPVLAAWPLTLQIDIDGLGPVLFCHATPRNDSEIFTRLTPEDRLVPMFDAAGAPLVVCGVVSREL